MLNLFPVIADIEGFFGIVFFLIAFVGWVINLVNQNQDPKKQGRTRPSPKARSQQSVQQEIDEFLAQSRRGPGQQHARQPQRQDQTDDVELIAPPQARRPAPRRRKSREEVWSEQTGQPSKARQNAPKQTKPKRSQGLAEKYLQKSSQTSQPAENRSRKRSTLADQIEADLPHAVDAGVAEHLKIFTAESPTSIGLQGISETTNNRRTKANILASMLRTPKGIRQAILMNEILSPPKSLRK